MPGALRTFSLSTAIRAQTELKSGVAISVSWYPAQGASVGAAEELGCCEGETDWPVLGVACGVGLPSAVTGSPRTPRHRHDQHGGDDQRDGRKADDDGSGVLSDECRDT